MSLTLFIPVGRAASRLGPSPLRREPSTNPVPVCRYTLWPLPCACGPVLVPLYCPLPARSLFLFCPVRSFVLFVVCGAVARKPGGGGGEKGKRALKERRRGGALPCFLSCACVAAPASLVHPVMFVAPWPGCCQHFVTITKHYRKWASKCDPKLE